MTRQKRTKTKKFLNTNKYTAKAMRREEGKEENYIC